MAHRPVVNVEHFLVAEREGLLRHRFDGGVGGQTVHLLQLTQIEQHIRREIERRIHLRHPLPAALRRLQILYLGDDALLSGAVGGGVEQIDELSHSHGFALSILQPDGIFKSQSLELAVALKS